MMQHMGFSVVGSFFRECFFFFKQPGSVSRLKNVALHHLMDGTTGGNERVNGEQDSSKHRQSDAHFYSVTAT